MSPERPRKGTREAPACATRPPPARRLRGCGFDPPDPARADIGFRNASATSRRLPRFGCGRDRRWASRSGGRACRGPPPRRVRWCQRAHRWPAPLPWSEPRWAGGGDCLRGPAAGARSSSRSQAMASISSDPASATNILLRWRRGHSVDPRPPVWAWHASPRECHVRSPQGDRPPRGTNSRELRLRGAVVADMSSCWPLSWSCWRWRLGPTDRQAGDHVAQDEQAPQQDVRPPASAST